MGKSISNLLDIPIENVTVMLTRMGGGFGRRLYGNFGLEAATISYNTGKPIKLIYTREDDMTQGVYRPAYKVKYRAALDEKNELSDFQSMVQAFMKVLFMKIDFPLEQYPIT